ncbi:MAG: Gldg family protein [Verrucomicrobiales bacterium]|nr:Gldg family protein [Verrucomicrobiales bacterium]
MAKSDNKESDVISRRQWSTVGHFALRIVLMLVVFIQLNYLGCRHYGSADFSRNQKFTLSDRTAGFLRSLGNEVQIVSAFLGTSDVLPDVKGLLNEYDRIGGDQVTAEILDLSRSRSRIAALRDKYNLELSRDQLVVIGESGRVKVISSDELVTRDAATGRILEFKGEEKLTSALLEVTEQQQKKVYIITGDRSNGLISIAKQLQALTSAQNARLEQLILRGRQSIPADADALVFAGNTRDISKAEADMVRSYWEDRKGGLVIMLDPAAETPNLNSILRENGVVPRDDRVLTQANISGLASRKNYNVPVTIMPGFGPTRDLPILSLQLMDRTQSLAVQTNDEIFISQNIRPQPLMITSQMYYWGEKDYDAEDVSFDPDEDVGRPNPVYTAAAIEKGRPGGPTTGSEVSRLVVIGNPNLISPDGNTQKTAADFCIASINWVMNRDQLLGIAPRQPSSYNLFMRSATFGLLQTLVVWVIPTVLLFCGALVWYRRRA